MKERFSPSKAVLISSPVLGNRSILNFTLQIIIIIIIISDDPTPLGPGVPQALQGQSRVTVRPRPRHGLAAAPAATAACRRGRRYQTSAAGSRPRPRLGRAAGSLGYYI